MHVQLQICYNIDTIFSNLIRDWLMHKGPLRFLTLKTQITTAADDNFCDILPDFQKNKA